MSSSASQHNTPPVPPDTLMPTWVKFTILANYCDKLSIATKREIFAIMRQQVLTADSDTNLLYHRYLPQIGLTLGECSLFHTISEHLRRKDLMEFKSSMRKQKALSTTV
jgi:hypothetical protein